MILSEPILPAKQLSQSCTLEKKLSSFLNFDKGVCPELRWHPQGQAESIQILRADLEFFHLVQQSLVIDLQKVRRLSPIPPSLIQSR
jgi:hypothetical protein